MSSPLLQLVAAVGGTGDVFGAAQAARRGASGLGAVLARGLAEPKRMARGTEQSAAIRNDTVSTAEASAALARAFACKPSEMRASLDVDPIDEIQFGRGSSDRIAVPAIESPATMRTDGEPLDDGEVPATSRIERAPRRNRRTRQRSQTIAMKRVSRAERAAYAQRFPIHDVEDLQRPRTRAECKQQEGPCPWVACKHHLYLDINPLTGSIKLNFPDLEPWELEHTCALDVAEAGALTLEQVGAITNLTRERVRQVEVIGLAKLGASARRNGLR